MQLTDISLGQLVEHDRNVRLDLGDVTELADSIKALGILEPLVVAPAETKGKTAKFRIIAGHRRAAAAKQAGLKQVPAIVRDDLTTEASQVEAMLVENLQRAQLSPVEEARGYQTLLDLGTTQAAIAKATGRSKKTVSLRLGLAKLPDDMQDKVHAGQVTLEQAEVLAAHAKDETAYSELARYVGTANFAWTARRIAEDKKFEKEKADLATELAAEGVRVSDRVAVHRITLDALGIRPEEHTGCPGHAAVVTGHSHQGARVVYICEDPDEYGHATLTPPVAGRTAATATATDGAEAARLHEERQQLRADLQTAHEVRWDFLQSVLSPSFSPSAEQIVVMLRYVAAHVGEFTIETDAEQALHLAGLPVPDDYDEQNDAWRAAVESATTPGRLAQLLVAACGHETLTDLWYWQQVGEPHLTLLQALGYEPSDVERRMLAEVRAKREAEQAAADDVEAVA